MTKSDLKNLISECINETLGVEEDPNNPLYVEYEKPMTGEIPFNMNGEKFEFCWGKYPNGKLDIAVYATRGDMCYGYQAWKKRYNVKA